MLEFPKGKWTIRSHLPKLVICKSMVGVQRLDGNWSEMIG